MLLASVAVRSGSRPGTVRVWRHHRRHHPGRGPVAGRLAGCRHRGRRLPGYCRGAGVDRPLAPQEGRRAGTRADRRVTKGGSRMGEGAGESRQDISLTLERMGGNLDALGYRVDVPARARDFYVKKPVPVIGGARSGCSRPIAGIIADAPAARRGGGALSAVEATLGARQPDQLVAAGRCHIGGRPMARPRLPSAIMLLMPCFLGCASFAPCRHAPRSPSQPRVGLKPSPSAAGLGGWSLIALQSAQCPNSTASDASTWTRRAGAFHGRSAGRAGRDCGCRSAYIGIVSCHPGDRGPGVAPPSR